MIIFNRDIWKVVMSTNILLPDKRSITVPMITLPCVLPSASAALEESANRMRDGLSATPITLTFSGVSNFNNQVGHFERVVGAMK
ncbi:hypothetical protein E2C01_005407 [Portunus trituberculatus]|uniref:Uncharacterized protein n=1 Tax=Portunus trituberculatus TaxID=210409 RepID=A0A5B7CZ37_PORTR|nr:hypothetical protein [Portunus trituberculatus]